MESLCRINLSQGNNDHQIYCHDENQHIFSIDVEVRYISAETSLQIYSSSQSFTFNRDMFLSEAFGPNLVISMYPPTPDRHLCVSSKFIQTDIVPEIMSFARETSKEPCNMGRQVIKMMIQVVHMVNIDTLNFKPACSSSVQDLKRTTWGGGKKRRLMKDGLMSSGKEQCTICLDEFLRGDEVASMPCGHVYHDTCLVKWLKTSHFCPLCRYQMPSAQADHRISSF